MILSSDRTADAFECFYFDFYEGVKSCKKLNRIFKFPKFDIYKGLEERKKNMWSESRCESRYESRQLRASRARGL